MKQITIKQSCKKVTISPHKHDAYAIIVELVLTEEQEESLFRLLKDAHDAHLRVLAFGEAVRDEGSEQ